MKIKMLNKFEYKYLPIEDDFIEVDDEELKRVGYDRCFDVERNCIVPMTIPDEILIPNLRSQREVECFSIINQIYIVNGKSATWFDTLTEEQKIEAEQWLQAWRDVTETKVIPEKPVWLK